MTEGLRIGVFGKTFEQARNKLLEIKGKISPEMVSGFQDLKTSHYTRIILNDGTIIEAFKRSLNSKGRKFDSIWLDKGASIEEIYEVFYPCLSFSRISEDKQSLIEFY